MYLGLLWIYMKLTNLFQLIQNHRILLTVISYILGTLSNNDKEPTRWCLGTLWHMNHAIKFSYYAGFVGQQSTITNWCSVLEKQENRHWYHYAQISLINKIELRFKKKMIPFRLKTYYKHQYKYFAIIKENIIEKTHCVC